MKEDLAKKILLTTSRFASKKKFREKLVAGFPGISGADKIGLSAKMSKKSTNLKSFTGNLRMQMQMIL